MMHLQVSKLPQWLVLLVALWASFAWADGTITHLSGAVSVQTADGKTIPGAAGVKVGVGDTVITGAGGYARLAMTDGGEMVLRPDSQLKIERYNFAQGAPAEDSFAFSMLKGGMRAISGLVGKRGNVDAYRFTTPTATVGIRGTQYDARICAANCGALADGTYLAVQFGAIQATNPKGSLAVAAGQVAFVPPQQVPVLLPRNPGIGFTPPPVIPKLNEKKKAADAAAAPTPATPAAAATTTTPATTATTTAASTTASTSTTAAASTDKAAPAAQSTAVVVDSSRPTADAAAPPAAAAPAAAAPAAAAVECVVQ